MKRLISLLLCLLMTVSLAACAETAEPNAPSAAQTPGDLSSPDAVPTSADAQTPSDLTPAVSAAGDYRTPSDVAAYAQTPSDIAAYAQTPSDIAAYAQTPSDIAYELPPSTLEGELTVYAPDSMSRQLSAVRDAFERICPGVSVDLHFADTAAIKALRAEGGVCDVYLTDAREDMDALDFGVSAEKNPDRTNLVLEGTRRSIGPEDQELYDVAVLKTTADPVLALYFLDYVSNGEGAELLIASA